MQEKKFDINQIIGFVLMTGILIGFMWWMQPSQEELAAQEKEKQEQLEAQKKAQKEAKALAAEATTETTASTKPKKVSYKIQREYDLLPRQIEALEQELEELEAMMADDHFYTQDFEQIQPFLEKQTELKDKLEKAMTRWVELEDQINS